MTSWTTNNFNLDFKKTSKHETVFYLNIMTILYYLYSSIQFTDHLIPPSLIENPLRGGGAQFSTNLEVD